MANLPERSFWPDRVYMIEPEDPPMGGEWGISNIAHKQLACRLTWLRNLFLREHGEDGRHFLRDADVLRGAAIPESRLALDIPTAELHAMLARNEDALEVVRGLVANLDAQGESIPAMYRALLAWWKTGRTRINFDFFIEGFTFRDYSHTAILDLVSGDDSLDVADTTGIRPDDWLLLSQSTGWPDRQVIVESVLSDTRLVLTEEIHERRTDGIVTHTNWDVAADGAHAMPGDVYFTEWMDTLEYGIGGDLTICHDSGNRFQVSYRWSNEGGWSNASIGNVESIGGGMQRTSFHIMTGGRIVFRITALTEAHVAYMSLQAVNADEMVRTPRTRGRFQVTRYGSIYGVPMQGAQLQISEQSDFSLLDSIVELSFGQVETENPYHDWSDEVLAQITLEPGKTYFWRMRQQSAEGRWSQWSPVASFTEA